MKVLGLGGSNHDYSACIVENGSVIAMIEDERITRKKHGKGLHVSISQGFSRKYVFDQTGYSLTDMDIIASNDLVNPSFLFRLDGVVSLNHHLTHAASAYYCSPFQEAAILTVDSVGSRSATDKGIEYESCATWVGNGTTIERISHNTGVNLEGTDYIENSLGIFYSLITNIIGFGELEEGKTMGLAPYGTDRMYKELQRYIHYAGNGKIQMTADSIKALLAHKDSIQSIPEESKRFQVRADYAWAGQKITEDILLQLCEDLYERTPEQRG